MQPPFPSELATATYEQIRAHEIRVAVLPLGATEPHNLHLPYGTDIFEADAIGRRICQEANRRGGKVILLPTIPFGTQTNQRGFPLALNLYPSTITTVIRDLVESIEASGIRKIVLLNSHGGNELKSVLRELHGRTTCHLFLCFWPQVVRDCYAEIFAAPDDHAGEMETSLALACFPDYVRRTEEGLLAADSGEMRPFRFRALSEGWVQITRPWHLLTTNSGAGNPHQASAEKGERLLQVLESRIGEFLCELSEAATDASFPFVP